VYVVETTSLGLGMVMCWSIAVAPTLLSTLFSDRWAPAVPVFQLMAAASLLAPQTHFLRGIGLSAGRARPLLLWSAFCGIVILIAFPFLVTWLGLLGGGLGFLGYAALQLYGYWRATRSVAAFPWIPMLRIYAIGAVAGIAAAATLLFVDGLLGLFVSGLVFLAVYGALGLVFERPQLSRAWQLLRSGTVPGAV
jgi:O-antigen/teichoic acid export membrane protein